MSKESNQMTETSSKTVVERLLAIDSVYLDRWFTLGMFAFFATLLYITKGYSDESQVFPYTVGIPCFVLVVALLLVQSSSRVSNLIDEYSPQDLFDIDDSFGGEIENNNEVNIQIRRVRAFAISGWIIILFLLIYFLGFLPATFLFMLAYFKTESELAWPQTVLSTVLVWLFIVVLFDIILQTPFYTGVFDIIVPVPG